jgi:aryl-alcohol dehydrogenase-like predicted oxidoreductase
MAPFSEREPSLRDALGTAHEAGLGVLAIKGLFSGHLEAAPAIDFVLQQRFVDSLIVGTISPGHLRGAVAIADRRAD